MFDFRKYIVGRSLHKINQSKIEFIYMQFGLQQSFNDQQQYNTLLMIQNSANQLSIRRESFRIQIRKHQIHNLLRQKRKKIKQSHSYQNEYIENIPISSNINSDITTEQFKTQQLIEKMPHSEKQELVQSIALQLRGQQNLEWYVHINTLFKLLPYFVNCYEFWFEIGIIQRIILVFQKNEFFNDQLASHAAHLISNLIAHNKTVSIAKYIISYEGFIKNIIRIIHQNEEQRCSFLNYLHLSGNLIGENGIIRNIFIQYGFAGIILRLAQKLNTIQQKRLIIWNISNILREYDQTQQNLKFNIHGVFLPVINQFILYQDPQIIQSNLFTLQYIFGKQENMKMEVFNTPNIKSRLLEFLLYPDFKIRLLSLRICCILISCNNYTIINYFIYKNIYDILEAGVRKYPPLKTMKKQIIQLLIEVVIRKPIQTDTIVRSGIFNIIIEFVHITQQLEIRRCGLLFLLKILKSATYSQMEYLLKTYSLLHIIIENIKESDKIGGTEVIYLSLKCIQSLMETYEKIYSPVSQNTLIQRLENHYQFLKQLENLSQKIGRNKKIQKAIERIIEFYSFSS